MPVSQDMDFFSSFIVVELWLDEPIGLYAVDSTWKIFQAHCELLHAALLANRYGARQALTSLGAT